MGKEDHSLHELIKGCIDRDLRMMEQFYHLFAPEMWVVCLRYARSPMMAEDAMQEGFIRAFDTMASYSGKGSFRGWLRRVFVTTTLNHLKKHHRFERMEYQYEGVYAPDNRDVADALSALQAGELMELLRSLPNGAREVFNLYVVEGYSHREIGQMLGFSEGNSRSQLYRARMALQKSLEEIALQESMSETKRNDEQLNDNHHGTQHG
jgi:RNA polymerase sigma factor (sigma-70 family)